MQNIFFILAMLAAPFFALAPFGVPEPIRGRIAIAFVFIFNGVGHFRMSRRMTSMVTPKIPKRFRLPIIYVSGVMEFLMALAILIPPYARMAGIVICTFLVLVLPVNIDSAMRRVPIGGHNAGPTYLLWRIPLQCLLIGWVYFFAVRGEV